VKLFCACRVKVRCASNVPEKTTLPSASTLTVDVSPASTFNSISPEAAAVEFPAGSVADGVVAGFFVAAFGAAEFACGFADGAEFGVVCAVAGGGWVACVVAASPAEEFADELDDGAFE
jgi:hypothetical protein